MCGRYAIFAPPQKLKDLFGTENLLEFSPRYNAAPGQELPIIVHNRAGLSRWGFGDMINSRSETVADKPLFRESWHRRRRCLVPADGFYEWKDKQPFFIGRSDRDPLALAGLWLKEKDVVKFVILTKAADGPIKNLHDRMPVILNVNQAAGWFAGDEAQARQLIAQASANNLVFHPVGRNVGYVANDDETLIRALS